MSKYGALGDYLRNCGAGEIPMTFAEIERIVGTKLPPSAYVHRPWWSNNASNSVLTKVWLAAGYRSARVDMAARSLVFARLGEPQGVADEPEQFKSPVPETSNAPQQRRHPLFGALKGTFTIDPDWDLTQPAMPEWADFIDEKYGPEKRR